MHNPLETFGKRSVRPCGDCNGEGECTMNCGPALKDRDLPKILRDQAETDTSPTRRILFKEAANEIERLAALKRGFNV